MKRAQLNHTIVAALALAVGLAVAKADEKSSVYQSLLAKYDANKDGRLSAAEREVIRIDRLQPETRERSGRRSFRYPDTVVARFDKDDDNELDGEEFAAARDWPRAGSHCQRGGLPDQRKRPARRRVQS